MFVYKVVNFSNTYPSLIISLIIITHGRVFFFCPDSRRSYTTILLCRHSATNSGDRIREDAQNNKHS